MDNFHDQVCAAVCEMLLEKGYEAWWHYSDLNERHRIFLNGLGCIVVLLPCITLFDLNHFRLLSVEVNEPDSFDRLAQAVEAERLLRLVIVATQQHD